MNLTTALAWLALPSVLMFGQDTVTLESKLESVRYPPIARQARIQGDVRLLCKPNGVAPIAGHPLLVSSVIENLKGLEKIQAGDVEVIYHFALVDPMVISKSKVVRKGDAFDRLILRILHLKTERVVEEYDCVEDPNQPRNRADTSRSPIEVWIYGAIPCLQTDANVLRADRIR